jgi:hypothetical protein
MLMLNKNMKDYYKYQQPSLPTKFKSAWEQLEADACRMKVYGGWLVSCCNGCIFVSDPHHAWEIVEEKPKFTKEQVEYLKNKIFCGVIVCEDHEVTGLDKFCIKTRRFLDSLLEDITKKD